MAIDPVTLSLILKGVGKAAPAIGEFFGSRAGAKALEQDPSQIAQQYEELKKNMPQYGMSSGWNEYLAMAKQDPAADAKRQIAAEQEASIVGALKSGGDKALLGGLQDAQTQSAQQRMQIEAESQETKQQALAKYADQQQKLQDANTLMAKQLAQSQFQAEQGAEQYNRLLKAQKKKALGAGLGYLAGGLASGLPDEIKLGLPDGINLKGLFGGNQRAKQAQESARDFAQNISIEDTFDLDNDPSTPYKEGGMITEGAFSHKTNPIDIVQDGVKKGEMTGGEAILTPKQQKKVAKQSPYFRKLMREFAMRRNND